RNTTCAVTLDVPSAVLAEIPAVKLQQFAAEARALPAYEMRRFRGGKRYALAAALLRRPGAKGGDELTEMFLRRMHKLHHYGEEALEEYRRYHQERTDALISLLCDVTQIVIQEGAQEDRWAAIVRLFHPDPTTILARCEEHRAHAGNNY